MPDNDKKSCKVAKTRIKKILNPSMEKSVYIRLICVICVLILLLDNNDGTLMTLIIQMDTD